MRDEKKVLIPRKVTNKGYFLGTLKDGDVVYMEKPKFDCGWYWGFGYIEIYKHEYSKEQHTHTHWDTRIVGKHDYYDVEKECFIASNDYIHHLNDNKEFHHTVLTDKMSWALAELMKTAYQLREQAELYYLGGSHITTNPLKDMLKDIKQYKHINGVLLPAVFNEIDKILNPNHEDLTAHYQKEFSNKVKKEALNAA